MKDSRKQFIKDGHAAACSEWKTKIEKEFPKLFKETELEVGNWYFADNSKRFLHMYNGGTVSYGFNWSGDWCNDLSTNKSTGKIPATDKEVEEALIKEAKKIGFKEGAEFLDARFGRNKYTVKDNSVFRLSNDYSLCIESLGNGTVFSKGKWATIIETITKEEAEKLIGKTII